MALDESTFRALQKHVRQVGIPCEACNNLFPGTLRLTGPCVDYKKIKSYLKFALNRAADLGAHTVVFGSGTAKKVPEHFSKDEAYKQIVMVLELLASISEEYEITIVMEPLRKPECNILNTFRESVEVAKVVKNPFIRVLVDYYHMTWEHESSDVLLHYGQEYLRHVHFANPNMTSDAGILEGRLYPRTKNEWNYIPFVETLRKIGYDNKISIEAGSRDFKKSARDALPFMRELFPAASNFKVTTDTGMA